MELRITGMLGKHITSKLHSQIKKKKKTTLFVSHPYFGGKCNLTTERLPNLACNHIPLHSCDTLWFPDLDSRLKQINLFCCLKLDR